MKIQAYGSMLCNNKNTWCNLQSINYVIYLVYRIIHNFFSTFVMSKIKSKLEHSSKSPSCLNSYRDIVRSYLTSFYAPSIINNYWMRLSMISRIIQTPVNVICRSEAETLRRLKTSETYIKRLNEVCHFVYFIFARF